jgi:hypothetical protein
MEFAVRLLENCRPISGGWLAAKPCEFSLFLVVGSPGLSSTGQGDYALSPDQLNTGYVLGNALS